MIICSDSAYTVFSSLVDDAEEVRSPRPSYVAEWSSLVKNLASWLFGFHNRQ